uniref:Protein RFT1 homolog n=1 Tax=Romanomermis culicivorax TaxID=13658 RepID=A0A915L5E1_ROMCU
MNSVTKFTESALYNIIIQVCFRSSTFLLNAVLLRFISRSLLGVVNVRLMLLYTTLSFFSGEPFRRACLSRIDKLDRNWRKAVTDASFYAVRQILFAFLTIFYPENSLLNFGFAMIASSLLYTTMYYSYFAWFLCKNRTFGGENVDSKVFLQRFSDVLPHLSHGFDREVVRLTVAFFRHSFVKQMLTEGERYVMTLFDVLNFADQGVYDVVTNLGSLVARIIFAPLEESGYVYFSVSFERGKPLEEQDQQETLLATRVFKALLKLVTLIGFIITVFGFSFSFLALHVYGGTLLSLGRGPILLKWYTLYVVLLAINGVTECFSFAIMPESQVDRHQKWLFIFCFGFLIAALSLTNTFGSVGFILANCVNMVCRIIYSCNYINNFYRVDSINSRYMDLDLLKELKDSPLNSMTPNTSVFTTLLASFVITSLSNIIFCCEGTFNTLAHVAVGAICLLATVFRIYYTELEFVDFVSNYIFKLKMT